MTKKKAIEAAMEYAWQQPGAVRQRDGIAFLAAGHAYELGRIAGLREAARWVENDGIDRSDETYLTLFQLSTAIHKEANRLAKKARAK